MVPTPDGGVLKKRGMEKEKKRGMEKEIFIV
jgi:hypothetical protein